MHAEDLICPSCHKKLAEPVPTTRLGRVTGPRLCPDCGQDRIDKAPRICDYPENHGSDHA